MASSSRRRTSRSTSPPAASWRPPAPPASPPSASTSTATTSRRPRSRPVSTPASATSSSTRSRRSRCSRPPPPRAAGASTCSCASRPGVRPNTHDFVQTGQQDTKFGFGLADGRRGRGGAPPPRRAPPRARRRARPHRLADLRALLVPAARSRCSSSPSPSGAATSASPAAVFNIGGGLGIRYTAADQPSSIAEFAEVAVEPRSARGASGTACRCPRSSSSRDAPSPARRPSPPTRVGDRQGGPRRAHLRRRRRRHERQPAAHALRLQVRGHAGEQGRGAGDGRGHRRRQALRVRRRAGARRAHRAARARRHPGDAGHRRLRLRDGQQLQRAAAPGRGLGRRTARRASSSSERPGRTCCACSGRSGP